MHDIFEKIIAREIPAEIIYEDEMVIAFLDITPVNKGHTLIVPKIKFVNIFDGDSEILAHMVQVAKKIATAVSDATSADGVNLIMNNGAAAGQKIFHAHMHIVPRFTDDHVYQPPQHTPYAPGEIEHVAQSLRDALN